jgi:hypothetical protein
MSIPPPPNGNWQINSCEEIKITFTDDHTAPTEIVSGLSGYLIAKFICFKKSNYILEVAKTKRLKPLFPFSSNSSMAHSHI